MTFIGKGLALLFFGVAILCIVAGVVLTDTVFQEIAWFTVSGVAMLATIALLLGVIVAHIERVRRP